jgi:hypothetical protein
VYLYNDIEHCRIQTNNTIESECDSLFLKLYNSLQKEFATMVHLAVVRQFWWTDLYYNNYNDDDDDNNNNNNNCCVRKDNK